MDGSKNNNYFITSNDDITLRNSCTNSNTKTNRHLMNIDNNLNKYIKKSKLKSTNEVSQNDNSYFWISPLKLPPLVQPPLDDKMSTDMIQKLTEEDNENSLPDSAPPTQDDVFEIIKAAQIRAGLFKLQQNTKTIYNLDNNNYLNTNIPIEATPLIFKNVFFPLETVYYTFPVNWKAVYYTHMCYDYSSECFFAFLSAENC